MIKKGFSPRVVCCCGLFTFQRTTNKFTVALGGAPLALAGLAALAAARSTLAATAARREKIEAEIARREAQKKAFTANADAGGLAKAAGFLGAAFVSLGLIVANPMGGASNDFQLPSFSLPSIGQTAPAAKVVAEPKPPSPAEEARAKIRAAQAARMEEKVRAQQHYATRAYYGGIPLTTQQFFSASPMKPSSRRRPLRYVTLIFRFC
jgi:hypothetical protein